MDRVYDYSFGSVYPLYLAKVEKKGRTKAELHQAIEWLTGFDGASHARGLLRRRETQPARGRHHWGGVGRPFEDIKNPLMQ
jgi:hypothetical protein